MNLQSAVKPKGESRACYITLYSFVKAVRCHEFSSQLPKLIQPGLQLQTGDIRLHLHLSALPKVSTPKPLTLKMEFWGYTNKVCVDGLTKLSGFEPAQAGACLCSYDFLFS